METKNYFIIIIVILAFALISINLQDLTGSTTQGSFATIKVSPSLIKPGGTITITVTPGNERVKNEVKIYEDCDSAINANCQGNRIATIHLCSGNSYPINCRKPTTKKYQTSSGLNKGLYYAKITEYKKDDSKNYIERKAYFRIE